MTHLQSDGNYSTSLAWWRGNEMSSSRNALRTMPGTEQVLTGAVTAASVLSWVLPTWCVIPRNSLPTCVKQALLFSSFYS